MPSFNVWGQEITPVNGATLTSEDASLAFQRASQAGATGDVTARDLWNAIGNEILRIEAGLSQAVPWAGAPATTPAPMGDRQAVIQRILTQISTGQQPPITMFDYIDLMNLGLESTTAEALQGYLNNDPNWKIDKIQPLLIWEMRRDLGLPGPTAPPPPGAPPVAPGTEPGAGEPPFNVGGGIDQARLALDALIAAQGAELARQQTGFSLLDYITESQRDPFNIVSALQLYGGAGGGTLAPGVAMAQGGGAIQQSPYGDIAQQILDTLAAFVTGGYGQGAPPAAGVPPGGAPPAPPGTPPAGEAPGLPVGEGLTPDQQAAYARYASSPRSAAQLALQNAYFFGPQFDPSAVGRSFGEVPLIPGTAMVDQTALERMLQEIFTTGTVAPVSQEQRLANTLANRTTWIENAIPGLRLANPTWTMGQLQAAAEQSWYDVFGLTPESLAGIDRSSLLRPTQLPPGPSVFVRGPDGQIYAVSRQQYGWEEIAGEIPTAEAEEAFRGGERPIIGLPPPPPPPAPPLPEPPAAPAPKGPAPGETVFQYLDRIGSAAMARGGSMTTDEPIIGVGAQSGLPRFTVGEKGKEKLTVKPMAVGGTVTAPIGSNLPRITPTITVPARPVTMPRSVITSRPAVAAPAMASARAGYGYAGVPSLTSAFAAARTPSFAGIRGLSPFAGTFTRRDAVARMQQEERNRANSARVLSILEAVRGFMAGAEGRKRRKAA